MCVSRYRASFFFFLPSSFVASSSSHPDCSSSIRVMTRRRFTSRSRFLSYGEAADTQRGLRKSLVPPWLPSPRNGVDSIQPAIRSTMLYVANVNYEGNERWPTSNNGAPCKSLFRARWARGSSGVDVDGGGGLNGVFKMELHFRGYFPLKVSFFLKMCSFESLSLFFFFFTLLKNHRRRHGVEAVLFFFFRLKEIIACPIILYSIT